MKYKIFIIIISKTHLTMSNFAELQCFNKLLLKKMQRMEQRHKKEMEKLNNTYNSLIDETIRGGQCENVHYCEKCEEWFDSEYDDDCIGDYGMDWCCGACVEKGLCTLFKCHNCGECYEGDEYKEEYEKKMKDGPNDICNRCYKGYIIIDGGSGVNYSDDVNEMVYNRDKVMKELLNKVKTN